jgi:hypothetical protein
VKPYRLLSDVASDGNIEATFEWYESEQLGLGLEFLDEVRAAYTLILDGPFEVSRTSIRPVEADLIVVIAVLDTAHDLAEWQLRVSSTTFRSVAIVWSITISTA